MRVFGLLEEKQKREDLLFSVHDTIWGPSWHGVKVLLSLDICLLILILIYTTPLSINIKVPVQIQCLSCMFYDTLYI